MDATIGTIDTKHGVIAVTSCDTWTRGTVTIPYYPQKEKPSHCSSCGAPLDHSKDKCEYCDTFWG